MITIHFCQVPKFLVSEINGIALIEKMGNIQRRGYPTLTPDSLLVVWADTRGLVSVPDTRQFWVVWTDTQGLSDTGSRQVVDRLGRRCELIPGSSWGWGCVAWMTISDDEG